MVLTLYNTSYKLINGVHCVHCVHCITAYTVCDIVSALRSNSHSRIYTMGTLRRSYSLQVQYIKYRTWYRFYILDKHCTFCHNSDMAKKNYKPKGNKQQLLIALYIKQGMTLEQVAKKVGCSTSLASNINQALHHGWMPDLSEGAIASAPESPGFMGKKKGGSGLPVPDEVFEGNGDELQTKGKPAPAYVSFAAIQIKCQYTPIMYAARMVAEHLGWFPGDAPFEDFIDKILKIFYKDRGITLQGYIIDDEVEAGVNGDIAEIQKQLDELKEIVAKGGVAVG